VNSTYDEKHYTTEIDYGQLNDKIVKKAELIEKVGK
jgi:hypothetical protein